ncbi:MAG: hypothetical protein GY757_39310 [bacterium]|nr:hypothetical protein [bacterium]
MKLTIYIAEIRKKWVVPTRTCTAWLFVHKKDMFPTQIRVVNIALETEAIAL